MRPSRSTKCVGHIFKRLPKHEVRGTYLQKTPEARSAWDKAFKKHVGHFFKELRSGNPEFPPRLWIASVTSFPHNDDKRKASPRLPGHYARRRRNLNRSRKGRREKKEKPAKLFHSSFLCGLCKTLRAWRERYLSAPSYADERRNGETEKRRHPLPFSLVPHYVKLELCRARNNKDRQSRIPPPRLWIASVTLFPRNDDKSEVVIP